MGDDELKRLIDELIGVEDIPGLNPRDIIPRMVDRTHAPELKSIPNVKDREDKRRELIAYYSDGGGRRMVDDELNSIKINFSAVKSQIESVKSSVQSITSQASIPAVITIGQASSTPNPSYSVIDAKGKRDGLLAVLKTAAVYAAAMLLSFQRLSTPPPSVVLTLVTSLAAVKKAVEGLGGK